LPDQDTFVVDYRSIIDTYYPSDSAAGFILLSHSRQVRDKALQVARRLAHRDLDLDFIAEAAMLHDIGAIRTSAPAIGCHGSEPYIRHGIIGRDMLETHGLPRHALVCERHIGVGLTRTDITANGLPLPPRDMLPLTMEETIISYADTFFSKTNGGTEHSLSQVLAELERFGQDKVKRFCQWHRIFNQDGS
jgi:uncharacterized protein